MSDIASDAERITAASGKSGEGQMRDTMSTKHSEKQCRSVSKCGGCRQPLEQWEAGFCEGCANEKEAKPQIFDC
jgi:hypothetical protein